MTDIFVHDIVYIDNDKEQCFKIMCYTDTEHLILVVHDFDLVSYIEHNEEIGNIIAASRYARFVKTEDFVRRRPSYYYHPEDQSYIRLRMRSQRRLNWAISDLRRQYPELKAWEHDVVPITRFMFTTKIKIGRWYRLPYPMANMSYLTASVREQIVPLHERVGCPPQLTMCCFDLETSGLNFDTDTITMIGMVMYPQKVNIVLHLYELCDERDGEGEGKGDDDDEMEVLYLQCASEREMVENFTKVLLEYKVSIVTGCNTTGFDWQMLFSRAHKLNVAASFFYMSWWFPDVRVDENYKLMVRGMSDLKTIDVPGVRCMDLKMIALNTFIKLGSYSLNNIARSILDGSRVSGAQKHDLHWTDVIKCADPDHDPRERAKVARYCIRDCYLVVWCFEQRNYIDLFFNRCSLFNINIPTAMYAGLTQTLPGMMMEKIHDDNKVFNHNKFEERMLSKMLLQEADECFNPQFGGSEDGDEDEDSDEDDDDGPQTVLTALGKRSNAGGVKKPQAKKTKKGYAGGFVVEPKSGLRRAVCICDYQSLYPSLMEKYYLCFSTLLKPGDEHKYPPEEVTTANIDENTKYYFKVPDSIHDTVIPSLQTRLKVFRKEAKAEMKKYPPGSVEYAAYDNKQNNIKLSMNGFYGVLGTNGMAQPVAASVTALGRDTILKTIEIAEQEFGCTVVYGDTDSVMIQDPRVTSIMTLEDREMAFECMKEITSRVSQYWHTEVRPFHAKPVLILEPETMCNGYFFKKKKYAMLAYETGNLVTPKKFATKGMEPTKRDFSTMAQDAIRNFLYAIVTDQHENASKVVADAIRFIHESAESPSPEMIQKFVITESWGKEEYADPREAHVVATRTKQRVLENEKWNVSSTFNVGDRIPYVHVDADTRDVLERHILKFRNFSGVAPHATAARGWARKGETNQQEGEEDADHRPWLGNKKDIRPLPTNEWQEIILCGKFRFKETSGGRRQFVLTWSNVGETLQLPSPEDIYFDGVRAKEVRRTQDMQPGAMARNDKVQWIFDLPRKSCFFTTESPDFARKLNTEIYIDEIRSPIMRYVKHLIDTSNNLLRTDLTEIERLFNSDRLARKDAVPTRAGANGCGRSVIRSTPSSAGNTSSTVWMKRQISVIDSFMRAPKRQKP